MIMKETKLSRLSERYLAALRSHLKLETQSGLLEALELGTQAVVIGLETLDLAKMHERALLALVLPDSSASRREGMISRAAAFFTEALAPIEKTHRIALEASADLNQLNATLAQRTMDLADANRELEQGITERKAAVNFLKSSEGQSAKLLEESRQLQKHLQGMAHQILSAQEDERKSMSLKLQDDIAQTLLGIHIRLMALKNEVAVSTAGFNKEIATTQRLVQESVKTISDFAREYGIQDEN
jgi:signal transduction histidine kinase